VILYVVPAALTEICIIPNINESAVMRDKTLKIFLFIIEPLLYITIIIPIRFDIVN
jgi:hypothetical protein